PGDPVDHFLRDPLDQPAEDWSEVGRCRLALRPEGLELHEEAFRPPPPRLSHVMILSPREPLRQPICDESRRKKIQTAPIFDRTFAKNRKDENVAKHRVCAGSLPSATAFVNPALNPRGQGPCIREPKNSPSES